MAQLNMMQNHPWNYQQPWGNFNGSNMSLNLPHQYMHGGEFNPWMQQYPYQYPMPNGMLSELIKSGNAINFSQFLTQECHLILELIREMHHVLHRLH
jgi:hypothetical protein